MTGSGGVIGKEQKKKKMGWEGETSLFQGWHITNC